MHERAIDVHSHLYPASFVAYLRKRETPPFVRDVEGTPRFMLFPGDRGVAMTEDFTSAEAKVAFMEAHGIARSVLSLGNPWLDLDPGPESVALADRCNAELVGLAASCPERLSAMGALPNADVLDAVRCVERLAAAGEVVGLVTGTTICGLALDSPKLEYLWDAVEAARLPVLVHPQAGLAAEATRGHGQAMTLALAFPFETTAAVARLVLAGVLDQRPSLRIIAAHGGGTFPYLMGRLGRAVAVDAATSQTMTVPDGLYVDSVVFSRAALKLCAEALGADRILFGTDHPFPIADATAGLADLGAVAASQPDMAERVACRNATELFGLAPA